MTGRWRIHLAAWLGLFAMLMVIAGPLYAQLRAPDRLTPASVELHILHCGDADQPSEPSPPGWLQHLDQCAYCSFLANNPPLEQCLQLALPAPGRSVLGMPAYDCEPTRQTARLARLRGPPRHPA